MSHSDNAELREKRDILLNKLKQNISDDAAFFYKLKLPSGMGDYAITLMMDESENFLKIDDGLSFDFDNYECAPEEFAERFKDNESDNHEIGNCFLKIEKRITIITMFELNADFLKQHLLLCRFAVL